MSEGQHVGAMASDIGKDKADLELARAQIKAVKPRALGPKYREGDGPLCPEPGDHGRTYVMPSGNLWCPVTNALYGRTPSGSAVGPLLRGPAVRANTTAAAEEDSGGR